MRKVTEGKIPMDLLPGWRALAPLARVMHWANTEGGYSRDTWREVPPEEYRAALARHFFKWLDDPHARDEKSGFSHLAHLGCCVLFLLWHGDAEVQEPQLYWYCNSCGNREPAQSEYDSGDSEPCCLCEHGVARVMTLAECAQASTARIDRILRRVTMPACDDSQD